MKLPSSLLIIVISPLFGCDIFIEEYVAPDCEGGKLDVDRNLCWQDPRADGDFQSQEAIDYCDNLTLAERTDWRLPDTGEFAGLLGECGLPDQNGLGYSCNSCDESVICNGMFGTDNNIYWSSSVASEGIDLYNLGDGSCSFVDADHLAKVRCVRPE